MEQKRTKWTAIDTVIVFIVLAAAVFAAVKMGPVQLNKTEKEKMSFTVMLKEQEPEMVSAMSEGDRVTVSLTEKDGGVITDIKTEPSERLSFNSIDGKYINELVSDKTDIYVTVEADCTISDTAFKTGDTDIKVGKEIPLKGKGYSSMGYIVTINN